MPVTGPASRLRIGVARDEGGEVCAHSWVEVDGRMVIGGEGPERYESLPELRPTS